MPEVKQLTEAELGELVKKAIKHASPSIRDLVLSLNWGRARALNEMAKIKREHSTELGASQAEVKRLQDLIGIVREAKGGITLPENYMLAERARKAEAALEEANRKLNVKEYFSILDRIIP